MRRQALSSVDAAWLRMEDPTNLMMVTGIMVFGAPVDPERLKATLELGLRRFGRFRQRVAHPPCGRAYWEDDPDFDINYHLQQATLPPPGDQAALQDLASLLAGTPLDMSRPLWQFHLIEEYGPGSALICRLHHAIGDGLALVHVLLSLTDTTPDTPWPLYQPRPFGPRRERLLRTATGSLRGLLHTTCQISGQMIQGCRSLSQDPSRLTDVALLGWRGTTSLTRLLLLWPDPKTALKGPLHVAKRAAWSDAIPLQDVKRVGAALGGTVNDVLVTAVAGALRRYLLQRGEEVEKLNFRAIVPVNLRRPGTEEDLGNKFGLVFLPLPLGIADPQERLKELRRRMGRLKDSLEAPVAFAILATLGSMPQSVQDMGVTIFGLKGTLVLTNVMGPKEQIYLAGAPLDALMFWVPQSGHLGVGISILSYADQVWLGLITDRQLVPDPEAIVAEFQADFEALLDRAEQATMEPDLAAASARLDEALATADELLARRSAAGDS